MKLIGLSGSNGAGKDTVGHLLAAKHEFLFVSVSDLLREEARRRGQPVTREVLRAISAEWRREFGLGVLIDKAVEHCESFGDKYAGVIACPLRNVGEAKHLKELGGQILWIDADPRLRYDRIQANAHERGRSGEDDKTFEEFLAEEHAEMHPTETGDDSTLNVGAVKGMADATVFNDESDSLDDLCTKAEKALGLSATS